MWWCLPDACACCSVTYLLRFVLFNYKWGYVYGLAACLGVHKGVAHRASPYRHKNNGYPRFELWSVEVMPNYCPLLYGYVARNITDLLLFRLAGIYVAVLELPSWCWSPFSFLFLNIPFSLVPSEKFLIVKDDGCNNLALVDLSGCTFLASWIPKLCNLIRMLWLDAEGFCSNYRY